MEEPSSIFWGVVLVSVLVAVSAFFVAAKYALVRVRRTQMETMAAQGSSAAEVVLHGLNHLSRYIAGVQVGITLAGLASGLLWRTRPGRPHWPHGGAPLPSIALRARGQQRPIHRPDPPRHRIAP